MTEPIQPEAPANAVHAVLPFNLGLIESVRINQPAVARRAAEIASVRSFKKSYQTQALLKAVRCLDITELSGAGTPESTATLCQKGLYPVDAAILAKLGVEGATHVGAVCVYPARVLDAVRALHGRLPVASVATGFPSGETSLKAKCLEIEQAIQDGATEIDVVISRYQALCGDWRAVYNELVEFRNVCGKQAQIKTILGVGNLGTLENVAKASAVAIMAGADFIKTSTGMEPTNATPETGIVMMRQIRRLCLELGLCPPVGFKAAGGIKSAKQLMLWMALTLEELDHRWTEPALGRIGASSAVLDADRQLDTLATGLYSAAHRHAA